jgi:hypothetical protein
VPSGASGAVCGLPVHCLCTVCVQSVCSVRSLCAMCPLCAVCVLSVRCALAVCGCGVVLRCGVCVVAVCCGGVRGGGAGGWVDGVWVRGPVGCGGWVLWCLSAVVCCALRALRQWPVPADAGVWWCPGWVCWLVCWCVWLGWVGATPSWE